MFQSKVSFVVEVGENVTISSERLGSTLSSLSGFSEQSVEVGLGECDVLTDSSVAVTFLVLNLDEVVPSRQGDDLVGFEGSWTHGSGDRWRRSDRFRLLWFREDAMQEGMMMLRAHVDAADYLIARALMKFWLEEQALDAAGQLLAEADEFRS